MTKKRLIEDVKLEPQRFYRSPADVLRDRRFDDADRLEILSAWRAQGVPESVRDIEDAIGALQARGLNAAE